MCNQPCKIAQLANNARKTKSKIAGVVKNGAKMTEHVQKPM